MSSFQDPFERGIQLALDNGWTPTSLAHVQSLLDKLANEQKLGVRAAAALVPDVVPPCVRWALHAPNQEAALRYADIAAQDNGLPSHSVAPSIDGGVLRLFVEAIGGTVALFEIASAPPPSPAPAAPEARADLPRTPRAETARPPADQWSREWWAGQLLRVHSDLIATRFGVALPLTQQRLAAHVAATQRALLLSVGLVQSQDGRFDLVRVRFTLASPTNHVESRVVGQIEKPAALLLHPSERVATMAVAWLVECAGADPEIGPFLAPAK